MTDAIAAAIRAVAPHADATTWAATLAADMQSSGITTGKRIAMFIGQCAVESQWFTRLEENLNYTHADRLREVWPGKFPVGFDPSPYLGNPEALADYVYRASNGNHAAGDGWLFRGGGLIQITGRVTYTDFAHAIGKEPETIADWVRTPEGAARSACWFWGWAGHGGLNRAADAWIISDATKLIDPMTPDVGARIDACNRTLAALGAAGFNKPPAPLQVSAQGSTADDLNAAELTRVQS